MKPRVKLHEVTSAKPKTPVERARERHGKPFAHETGSTWQRHATPVLTQWMQSRGAKQ